ncbi:MAG: hypothetical protein PHU81_02685 [Acidobacteriota bacterium]|nr:hypothetical protein [Acidobacteriota bacterium]
MKIKKRAKKAEASADQLGDLGQNLPYVPVKLNEEATRSRRQTLSLMVKGAAFLAAWPLLKKGARADVLKQLVGEKAAAGSEDLTARQAARIIGNEVLHTNIPHKNIAHQNVPHTDTNPSEHVNENKHVDSAPPGFEHTNTTVHVNTNVKTHIDTPHQDTAHTNEPHTNVEHVNSSTRQNA